MNKRIYKVSVEDQSYEEMYGEEKAKDMKRRLSESMKETLKNKKIMKEKERDEYK